MFSHDWFALQLEKLSEYSVLIEYNSIVQEEPKSVPTFFTKKEEINPMFFSIFLEMFGKLYILEDQDITLIKNYIIENKEIIDNPRTLLNNLKNKFQPEKQAIFSDEIIRCFIINNIFKYKSYISYLKLFQAQQKAYFRLLKMEQVNSSNTISKETLRKFLISMLEDDYKDYFRRPDDKWYEEFYLPYVYENILFDISGNIYDRIDLVTLLNSPVFVEFLRLKKSNISHMIDYITADHEYKTFVDLCDTDDGITEEKMQVIFEEQVKFSKAFITRLYQMIDTKNQCATFVGYLQFIIPYRYSNTRQSIRFFFNLFDIDGDGYLSRDDIYYFFRGIMIDANTYDVNFDLFCSNLLDYASLGTDMISENTIPLDVGFKNIIIKLSDIKEFENISAEMEEEELLSDEEEFNKV